MSFTLHEVTMIGRKLATRMAPPSTQEQLCERVMALETLCASLQKTIDRCERKVEAHQLGRILINGRPYRGSPEIDELRALIIWVGERYGMTGEAILSHARWAQLIWPRHIAIWVARNSTQYSLNIIGQAFRRNHAAIIYACRSVENRCDTDPRAKIQRDEALAEWVQFRDDQRKAR